MKIKSVRYERLFNVGEYQNETIGFIADVEEKEKPEIALSKLYQMVTDANKSINKLREIANKLYSLQRDDGYYCSSIHYTEHEIERAKIHLSDLEKNRPFKRDSPEQRQYKRYKETLEEFEKELIRKKKEEKELIKQYQQMVNDFKKGIIKYKA